MRLPSRDLPPQEFDLTSQATSISLRGGQLSKRGILVFLRVELVAMILSMLAAQTLARLTAKGRGPAHAPSVTTLHILRLVHASIRVGIGEAAPGTLQQKAINR